MNCNSGKAVQRIGATRTQTSFQVVHSHSRKIILYKVPALFIRQLICSEEEREQVNLLLEYLPVGIQNQIAVIIAKRKFLQSFGVIETDKYARRTATLHTERKAVKHRKQIKQHIQVRERSAIKHQAVSLTAHYALAKQFLIARQKQIKAFGHRKESSLESFFSHC